LEDLNIETVCKTSGKRGLHIYIPLGARYFFEQAKQLAENIARAVHEENPALTSLERNPSKRQKKVYIDYLQNNYGQAVVSPYSVRPTPHATVSTPLKWTEVKKGLDPTQFTIKTIQKRLDKVGDLFKPILEKGINLEEALKKLAKQHA
jgi:bifunctional non-homologous end joining protein LigD